MGVVLAVAVSLAFALTNGFHDAANAIAVLVVTRVARPLQAVLLAAVCNVLGPLLVGTAVADTVAGIVNVGGQEAIAIVGAAVSGATIWNVFTWRLGMPSSSSHALVGGLVGAALVVSGPGAVVWGGVQDWRPVGVLGVLIALVFSVLLGFGAGDLTDRVVRFALRRGTRQWEKVARGGQWVSSAALAFSHGANDAQKAIGLVALVLFAGGRLDTMSAPLGVKLAAGGALTVGTAMGGWTIVRTIGRRIFRLRPLDGFVVQTSSTAVILASTFVGAPVSTTQVVASSVIGIGTARRRPRHVHWEIVREMGLAWITTLPASALLAIVTVPFWRWVT